MTESDYFPKKMTGGIILRSVYLMSIRNVQIDEEYCGDMNENTLS